MLEQAAHIIYEAHQHGLITILWMYLRGKAVSPVATLWNPGYFYQNCTIKPISVVQ